jgi:hypothetical protein
VLRRSYTNYILVKLCYEERRGYLSVYISDPEMARAKDAVSAIENALLSRGVDAARKDELWTSADTAARSRVAQLLRTDRLAHVARDECQSSFEALMTTWQSLDPNAGATKKDF